MGHAARAGKHAPLSIEVVDSGEDLDVAELARLAARVLGRDPAPSGKQRAA